MQWHAWLHEWSCCQPGHLSLVVWKDADWASNLQQQTIFLSTDCEVCFYSCSGCELYFALLCASFADNVGYDNLDCSQGFIPSYNFCSRSIPYPFCSIYSIMPQIGVSLEISGFP